LEAFYVLKKPQTLKKVFRTNFPSLISITNRTNSTSGGRYAVRNWRSVCVRQGCILFHFLFLIVPDLIMRKTTHMVMTMVF